MRKFFICAAVVGICLSATAVAVAQKPAEPVEMTIDTAYQGATPTMRSVERNFDWEGFRAGLARAGDQAVPNKLDFMFRTEEEMAAAQAAGLDAVLQAHHALGGSQVEIKSSFEGTSDDDNAALLGFRIVPPDTNGDVGRKYYAQMNNLVFEIFDKKTGNSVLGPLPNTAFWTGTGSVCEAFNDGDPIVLYDQEAKRWIFSQFAVYEFIPSLGIFVSHQCFAVSQSDDPTGAYYLYDFVYSVPTFGGFAALNDYPKIGVWPDGYYISVNEFEVGLPTQFVGASAGVFDRDAMLDGAPAAAVKFIIPFTGFAPAHFSLQPSHWEGKKAPPEGRANTFVQAFDDETWGAGGPDGPDGYWHWELAADFGSSTFSFTDLGLIPSANFDANLCNFAECIPQPAPATAADVLDTLAQFTMYRAGYRNFGYKGDDGDSDSDSGDSDSDSDSGSGHETIVVSHSVDADGTDRAGMRWAELRNSGAGFSVYQAGTYAPADGENRWLGSAAINKKGQIAVGYSVSSVNTFPSIRIAARGEDDPLGTLGPEEDCFIGTGSQLGSANRWGDYSSMSVDPKDEKTFWYTQEYYENSGSFDFKTRVCSFKVDDADSDSDSDSDSD